MNLPDNLPLDPLNGKNASSSEGTVAVMYLSLTLYSIKIILN